MTHIYEPGNTLCTARDTAVPVYCYSRMLQYRCIILLLRCYCNATAVLLMQRYCYDTAAAAIVVL